MKNFFLMLTTAILLLCMMQGGVSAHDENAISPTSPSDTTPDTTTTDTTTAGTSSSNTSSSNTSSSGTATVVTSTVVTQIVTGDPNQVTAQGGAELGRRGRRLGRRGRGLSMANPFLPFRTIRLAAGRIQFVINVVIVNVFNVVWIDPVIAVGYDYSVEKGPKVTGVELPAGIGDNAFDLWTYDERTNNYMDSGVDLEGGNLYAFNEPVSKFSIRGIETSAEVDAENETAFPTGLRFEKTGRAIVNMTSIPATNAK